MIGLDIMKGDFLEYSQCLFTTFRWQIMREGKPYKNHFIGTFEEYSPFYNSLSIDEREKIWCDFSNWPNKDMGQVDWAHMFVNMVLGFDWHYEPKIWKKFYKPKEPLSLHDINGILEIMERYYFNVNLFRIPENWKPL